MSDIAIISIVLSIIALTISIIHLAIEYLSKLRTEFPTIKISANDLPPYNNNEAKTLIKIQNIGTSIAKNLDLFIDYSYTEGETYIPLEDDFLTLNETIEKRVRLIEPPSGTHEVKFIVTIGKIGGRGYGFTKTIEIVVE